MIDDPTAHLTLVPHRRFARDGAAPGLAAPMAGAGFQGLESSLRPPLSGIVKPERSAFDA